jgi:hypothetical protein
VWDAVAAAALTSLFAITLLLLWHGRIHFYSTIGGLLPYDDAAGYYFDARRVLAGGTFGAFSARRPLGPGLLVTVLGLVHGNLQITVALLALMDAVCCFVFVREIGRAAGVVAMMAAAFVMFAFFFRYIGTTVTEHVGFSFGALGFAALWRSARNRERAAGLVGILLVTIALNARAGAFLILPMLVGWWSLLFGENRRSSAYLGVCGVLTVVFGFVCNGLVLRAIGPAQHLAFSNFAHTLYGQAVGGKGWLQVFADHPELKGIADPELSRRIYELAFEQLRAHPGQLILASLRGWLTYATPGELGAFSFVLSGLHSCDVVLRIVLFVLTAIGIVGCWRKRHEPTSSLVVCGFAAIVMSTPFLPPLDCIRMRPFAATIMIPAAAVALGLAAVLERVPSLRVTNRVWPDGSSRPLIIASLTALALLVLGPIVVRLFWPLPQLPASKCEPNEVLAEFRVEPGSYLKIVPDDGGATWVPRIRSSDLRRGLPVSEDLEGRMFFDDAQPGTVIFEALELRSGRAMIAAVPSRIADTSGRAVNFCGRSHGRFFTAEELAE